MMNFVKHFLGTEMYSKILQDNQINGSALLHIKPDGWKDIGISITGHRHTLFGWAQDKLHAQQDKVDIHKYSPRGSSNKQGHKREGLHLQGSDANVKRAKAQKAAMKGSANVQAQLGQRSEMLHMQGNDANMLDGKVKRAKTEKSLLRENFDIKSRAYSKNLSSIRDWFLDGAGPFSREEFIYGTKNETTSEALKDAIMAVILEKRSNLDENNWTDKDIYNKVRLHRNYLRSNRHDNEPHKMLQQRVLAKHPKCSLEALDNVSEETHQANVSYFVF